MYKLFITLITLTICLNVYSTEPCSHNKESYLCKSIIEELNSDYRRALLYAALACNEKGTKNSKECSQYDNLKWKIKRESIPVVKAEYFAAFDELIKQSRLKINKIKDLKTFINRLRSRKEIELANSNKTIKELNKKLVRERRKNQTLKAKNKALENNKKVLEEDNTLLKEENKNLKESVGKNTDALVANKYSNFLILCFIGLIILVTIVNFRKIKEILLEIFAKQING